MPASPTSKGYPRIGRGTGPWGGSNYVLRHNTSVDVYYQISSNYRTDGSSTSFNNELLARCGSGNANWYHANGRSCARPNGYTQGRVLVRAHEARHVTLAETKWNQEQLFENLDDMVDSNVSVRMARDEIGRVSNLMESFANFHSYASSSDLRYFVTEIGGWVYSIETHTY